MIDSLLKFWAHLPMSALHRAAATLGPLWWTLDRRHRQTALANIRLALGLPEAEAERLARANFAHLLEVFLQFPKVSRITSQNYHDYVECSGAHHLDASLRRGHGALLLTGHFGNWEWLAYCSPFLFGARLNVIARPLDWQPLNTLVLKYRQGSGNRFWDRKHVSLKVLRAL
ncbi:MAG: hypothetical protein D6722_18665, partial [Bacteroidetes bacterium]